MASLALSIGLIATILKRKPIQWKVPYDAADRYTRGVVVPQRVTVHASGDYIPQIV